MTDRTLPYASAVFQRASAELLMHNERQLSQELATIGRATAALVEAIHSTRDAATTSLQADARQRFDEALRILRGTTIGATEVRERAYEAASPAIEHLRELLDQRGQSLDTRDDAP